MSVGQTELREAILDPDAKRPDGLSDGKGHVAGRRFDVYRNNVAVSLAEALETAFPTIVKLVGAENFRVLAGIFLRQHPPSSPLMMFYGAEMPTFLETFEPAKSLPYLPGIAQLEVALRESYHAPDSQPVDPAAFEIAPEALMASTLGLAPSLRLIRSRFPIHAIWRFNHEDGAPKPQMAAEDVVILRPDMDPEPHLLAPGGGAFVEALLKGKPLGEAHELALVDAAFDLAQTLSLLIGAGAITHIGEKT
ncbi:MAG: DUF2063 domain-containing protein [Silicimonas sp.]|nr:DUF2063 domain-containing protein [Silicimonas sp.]